MNLRHMRTQTLWEVGDFVSGPYILPFVTIVAACLTDLSCPFRFQGPQQRGPQDATYTLYIYIYIYVYMYILYLCKYVYTHVIYHGLYREREGERERERASPTKRQPAGRQGQRDLKKTSMHAHIHSLSIYIYIYLYTHAYLEAEEDMMRIAWLKYYWLRCVDRSAVGLIAGSS